MRNRQAIKMCMKISAPIEILTKFQSHTKYIPKFHVILLAMSKAGKRIKIVVMPKLHLVPIS